tara:strand:- start:1414 stop:2340 length:927 start_codon:yes stop_codon:yes gene_type:complete
MGKHNAAIYILSSRTYLLKQALEFFYTNWNDEYDYPVYIHHFDDIYTQEFIDDIRNNISENISFHQIEYGVPDHIPESELFYNRTYLPYVRASFPPSRLGYLHMEHFATNLHKFGEKGCLIKEMEKYDYTMRIDDDSWFKDKIDFDFFDFVVDKPIATGYTWHHEHWRHENTTENIWKFYLSHLEQNNISPSDIKDKELRETVLNASPEEVHFPKNLELNCGNFNVYNVKMLMSMGFEHWMNHVNEYGGLYKHRWGDIETLELFTRTKMEEPVHNFDLRNKGLYEPQINGWQLAPSVQSDTNRIKVEK